MMLRSGLLILILGLSCHLIEVDAYVNGMTEFTGWGDWFMGLFSRTNLLIHNMYAVDPHINGNPEMMEDLVGKIASINRKMNRPKWYYYLNPFLGYFYERKLTKICDSLESVTSLTFKKCGNRFLKVNRCCYPAKMDENSDIYWGRSRPFAYRNAL
ncbi:uncharacterized protein LOC141853445 [Brevipalpus obovatus]|uniref:uncharacterized protein LOC141853445 n=1 Tax=Brevipalpus obovatus TaxID=246614 RepID=UPI003D9FB00A